MAEIALGIGTSHGPQLSTPPEEWGQRAAADRRNPALAFRGADYSFDRAQPAPRRRVRGRVRARRAGRAARAQPRRDRRARPRHPRRGVDVLVVVSSDHKEIYGDELLPQFAVYWGETMRHEPYTQAQLASMPPGLAVAEVANQPKRPEVTQRPQRAGPAPDSRGEPGRIRPGRGQGAARPGRGRTTASRTAGASSSSRCSAART